MTFAELRQINVARQQFPPSCDSWDVSKWAATLGIDAEEIIQFFRNNPGQLAVGRFQEIVPTLARVVIMADCIAARFGADLDKAVTEETK